MASGRRPVLGYHVGVKLAIAIAALGLATAHVAGALAKSERPRDIADEPFAPSPAAAPFVALGNREVTADLLWMRLTGYFGNAENTCNGVASLVEAITTRGTRRARSSSNRRSASRAHPPMPRSWPRRCAPSSASTRPPPTGSARCC